MAAEPADPSGGPSWQSPFLLMWYSRSMQAPGTDPVGLWLTILLTAIMLMAVLLWRRFLSRRRLMARVQELEALSGAGRAIVASELDVDALCNLIAHEVGQVIDNRTFQIGLFHGDRYQIKIWRVDGADRPPRSFDLSGDGGIIQYVRDTGQALLVQDFQRQLDKLPARPRYVSDRPARSGIFIPLISGGDVLGVMAAQSDRPHQFNDRDLRRLSILANQAAAAIENAQLFAREQKRAALLELVGQIAQKVNAISDLDDIFRQVVALTRATFGYHPVSICRLNVAEKEVIVQASSLSDIDSGRLRIPLGEGLVGTAAATGQTLVANRTADSDYFIADIDGLRSEYQNATRAEMAIPLKVESELLGVLDVQSAQEDVFTQAEQTALEALAAQVSSAIYRAEQVAQQRAQAWLTAAQLQVAEAVRGSDDLEGLAETITRLVPMLAGVGQCGLLIWDPEMELYRGLSLYGAGTARDTQFAGLELTLGDWLPLDAVHVSMEVLTTRGPSPWNNTDGAGPTTLLPLEASGQMLGLLVVAEPQTTGWSPDAERSGGLSARQDELLRAISRQVAQALESNLLRAAQQEEAWVNTALLQVAEAVSNLLDLHEILDTIVRFIPLLVGVDACVILVWDEEKEAFYAGPSYGVSEMGRGLLLDSAIELSEFLSIAEQEPDELAPSTTYYAVRLPNWMRTVLNTDLAQAFPLNARGRMVGALLVGPTASRRPLSGRRLSILTGIAHQAAIAVVNDRLYREAAEREKLERELDVARSIQQSLMPQGSPEIPGCDVAGHWQAARQVSGDFYDFLSFADGRWGLVVADVADKGVPAALFMALSRTILRAVAFNRTDPAATLMRVNDLICNDSQSDLFVTMFYAVWDPARQTLTYASGGHNPPLMVSPSGRCRELRTGGIALGVIPGAQIEQRQVRLRPGDTIVLYTDGVTEAMNEAYDEFGLDRLRLEVMALQNQAAAGIIQGIREAIDDHAGDTPQYDDITMIVFKRLQT